MKGNKNCDEKQFLLTFFFFNKWLVNRCVIMKITTLIQFHEFEKGLPTF